jgi:putative ABC transport system permease protein
MQQVLTGFRLALRNVLRQRRRSAFAIAAIAFGVAALMLATGFIEWNFVHYRETMIRSQLGHLQIHRRGYVANGLANPFAFLLPVDSPEMRAIMQSPGVTALAPRLSLAGLASHGDVTAAFIAEGVDPAAERALGESVMVLAGSALSAGDRRAVMMGQGLAASLGVAVGDTVVLLATTRSGGVNATEVRVRGTFATVSKAYDDVALRMPIAEARELLRVQGAHAWVVLLDDTGNTPAMLGRLRDLLAPDRYETVPWWSLSDFYNKSSRLFEKQLGVMKWIVALLIVLSISNTLMMNVMERTSEIGTSLALGVRRTTVLGRFLAEGLVLGGIGAALGVVVGFALAQVVSAIGIPVPPPPGMGTGYIGRVLVTPGLAAATAALAIATTFVASLYPAWRASRMAIVDALRHSRA